MAELDMSVGLELHVSAATPATFDKAGYEALSWTEVEKVESIPNFGGSAQVPEFIPIKTGVVDKGKGSINYGDITVPLGRVITDAGQVALQSGFDGDDKRKTFSVKLSHPDVGALYFTAIISGFVYNFGDANAFARNEVTFAIKSKPVPVDDVYTVTYAAGANGSIIGNAEQLVVDGGDATTVYAAPDSGYEFTEWTEDSSTDNPRTDTNVTADATYTATFTVV